MNGLTLKLSGNIVKTGSMLKSANVAAEYNRAILRSHIIRLEREVDKLRAKLAEREVARENIRKMELRLLPEKVQQQYHDARAVLLELSPAEEILYKMVINNRGMVYKEIASELNISERTVKFHMVSILRKAGVGRRIEL